MRFQPVLRTCFGLRCMSTRFGARPKHLPIPYAHFESETTASVQFGVTYPDGVRNRKRANVEDTWEHEMRTPRGGVVWAASTTRGVPVGERFLLRPPEDFSTAFAGSLSLGNNAASLSRRTTRPYQLQNSPNRAASPGPTVGVEDGWWPSADSPRYSPRDVAQADSPRFGPSSRFPIPPAGQHPNANESMHMARHSPAFSEELSKLKRQRAAAQNRTPWPQQLGTNGLPLATRLLGGGPSSPGASPRKSWLSSLLPTNAKY